MKSLACAVVFFLSLAALAQSPKAWLDLLNSEPGRKQKLTEAEVLFRPATAEAFAGLVAAGFRQSDGSFSLGSLIWDGKVVNPLAGYATILQQKGFAEADDQGRAALFLTLLQQSNSALGIHPYNGAKSREENRPQPIVGYRQVDGQHRFVVWFCEEPGNREGPEWREVLYLVNMEGVPGEEKRSPVVKARTLSTYHPVAEGLRGFPPIPSGSSE